jgi:hypothetical protein
VPSLPLYRPREGSRVHEKEREEKRALGLHRPSPPQASPVGPTVDNEGVCTSRPCPSPVLQAGATVLVVVPLSFTSAIGRSHRLVPHPALACGMVNRSPCLESHEDRAAQCWSTRCCWRRECPGIACGGRWSHQDASAPFLALGAWSQVHISHS